jgi:predicted LPLAT superfamily acyltransferase
VKPETPVPNSPAEEPRNPGPSWGYQFLRLADRVVPEIIFRPLRGIGTAIAMAGMPVERRNSREYLALVLKRKPTLRDVWRHFFAFEEALMDKLRAANGKTLPCSYAEGSANCSTWLLGDVPLLLGTFHVGASDLTGFLLGGYMKHPTCLVRQRVGNSHDTEQLAARFGDRLKFVWVNEADDVIFALKDAAATPAAIALQCDRVGFSARTESFEFLGAHRLFPVTIYYLALIFQRPVILSVGMPTQTGAELYASPPFIPNSGEGRAALMARARTHFQEFLHQLEELLRKQPYQWFNFTPLNPSTSPDPANRS